MLINISNHPSAYWQKEQLVTAIENYGEVVDIVFPVISPEWDYCKIVELAKEYLGKVEKLKKNNIEKVTVHIMGEFTFTYVFVNLLREHQIPAVASTAHRVVDEDEFKKTTIFRFIKFREYFKLEEE
ncbi:MAG: CRISPR-associated protein [Bacteroidetes bacterium]|nr:MAG: CRISPR-associated protein [Bacteroidota bacterium]